MSIVSAIFLSDAYKYPHGDMQPEGVTKIYSNMTARGDKYFPAKSSKFYDGRITVVGVLSALKKMDNDFKEWFETPAYKVEAELKEVFSEVFGGSIKVKRFMALHKLGYLPVQFRSVPEGTLVPIRVPFIKWWNTNPEFAWVVLFLESYISAALWKVITAATIASCLKRLSLYYANKTSMDHEYVDYQMHDFSMRGLSSPEEAATTGLGHLASFKGTDSVAALVWAKKVYTDKINLGGSVPATEHSIMMLGQAVESEKATVLRLLDIYPTGILSIVADTTDYWNFLVNVIGDSEVRRRIKERDGKVVIRPDSGDPIKIVCGNSESDDPYVRMGSLQILANIFGYTLNAFKCMEIDPHIGLIYGDGITYTRAEQILNKMYEQGFAASNIVFGVGSYTYQYITRDSLAMAVKTTYAEIDGRGINLLKDPKTDDGTKKSATGMLAVLEDKHGFIYLKESVSSEESTNDIMIPVYHNGALPIYWANPELAKLESIRKTLNEQDVDIVGDIVMMELKDSKD